MFNGTTPSSGWYSTFQEASITFSTAALLAGTVLLTVVYPTFFGSKDGTGIRQLGGLSVFTAWPFFKQRYDFLKSNFATTGENIFSFKVLHVSLRSHEIGLL